MGKGRKKTAEAENTRENKQKVTAIVIGITQLPTQAEWEVKYGFNEGECKRRKMDFIQSWKDVSKVAHTAHSDTLLSIPQQCLQLHRHKHLVTFYSSSRPETERFST